MRFLDENYPSPPKLTKMSYDGCNSPFSCPQPLWVPPELDSPRERELRMMPEKVMPIKNRKTQ